MGSQKADTRFSAEEEIICACGPDQTAPSTADIIAAASEGNAHLVRHALCVLGDEIVTHVDEDGMTALHAAAQRGHLTIVNHLLETTAGQKQAAGCICSARCTTKPSGEQQLPPSVSYSSMPSVSPSVASSDPHRDAEAAGPASRLPSSDPPASASGEETFSRVEKSATSSTTGSSTTSSGDPARRRVAGAKGVHEAALVPDHSHQQVTPSLWASVKSARGHTALHWAAIKGHVAVVTELVKAGFDFNERSNLGATALQLATAAERTEVVRFLVNCGADVSIKTNSGSSPQQVAQYLRNVEILEILEGSRRPLASAAPLAPLTASPVVVQSTPEVLSTTY